MSDMSQVITPKSDQINADDLIGRDMTITIRDVQIRGGQEQPVSIYFEGSDKAFRPCKSMSRVLVYCWGADAKQYVGRSLTLYRDANVKWGGMAVGGIRISHASHIDKDQTMVLAESKASRKPYTVKRLVNVPATTPADGAANYAATFVNLVEQCADVAALDKLTTDRAAKLDELKQKRPELFAEVDTAIATKRASFGTAGDDWNDGPATEQRGETHTATTTDEATATEILTGITSQKTEDALDAYLMRERTRIDALPEELQNRVSDAEAAKRAEWA